MMHMLYHIGFEAQFYLSKLSVRLSSVCPASLCISVWGNSGCPCFFSTLDFTCFAISDGVNWCDRSTLSLSRLGGRFYTDSEEFFVFFSQTKEKRLPTGANQAHKPLTDKEEKIQKMASGRFLRVYMNTIYCIEVKQHAINLHTGTRCYSRCEDVKTAADCVKNCKLIDTNLMGTEKSHYFLVFQCWGLYLHVLHSALWTGTGSWHCRKNRVRSLYCAHRGLLHPICASAASLRCTQQVCVFVSQMRQQAIWWPSSERWVWGQLLGMDLWLAILHSPPSLLFNNSNSNSLSCKQQVGGTCAVGQHQKSSTKKWAEGFPTVIYGTMGQITPL